MTKSLDDKLREILDYRKGTTSDRVEQIKQCFKENGWEESDGNS